jgi:hypothetical protein
MTVAQFFPISNVFVLPFWLLMIAIPHWDWTPGLRQVTVIMASRFNLGSLRFLCLVAEGGLSSPKGSLANPNSSWPIACPEALRLYRNRTPAL